MLYFMLYFRANAICASLELLNGFPESALLMLYLCCTYALLILYLCFTYAMCVSLELLDDFPESAFRKKKMLYLCFTYALLTRSVCPSSF